MSLMMNKKVAEDARVNKSDKAWEDAQRAMQPLNELLNKVYSEVNRLKRNVDREEPNGKIIEERFLKAINILYKASNDVNRACHGGL